MQGPIRLLVAGGRDYEFIPEDYALLSAIHARWTVAELIEGGASGADNCAARWARKNLVPVKTFNAEWGKYAGTPGKNPAGPIRNRDMAAYLIEQWESGDGLEPIVLLFPGRSGTESMRQEAEKAGLRPRQAVELYARYGVTVPESEGGNG